MSAGDGTSRHPRLRADRLLRHEEGACLPLRSRHGQCQACALACPTGALAVSVDAVVLGDSCIGCGRCTAACPTQALALPELARLAEPMVPAADAFTLRVECRKVPAHHRAPNTLLLPCVGALTTGHLLARQAAGVQVQIVDRGWCSGCEAGCKTANATGLSDHPAQAGLDAAQLWLEAVGCTDRPQLVREALPLAERPAAIPAPPEEDPKLDRRSFFRDALQRPTGRQRATATAMGADGRAAYPAHRRQASPERERQLAALHSLAQANQTSVPNAIYASLHVDTDCCDRHLCVALCPTGALTASDNGTQAQLNWSSDRCIGCGTCVRACPAGAMQLQPFDGQPGIHVLATHARQRCPSCDDVFTPAVATGDADATLCPTCNKSQRLMNDVWQNLSGAAS